MSYFHLKILKSKIVRSPLTMSKFQMNETFLSKNFCIISKGLISVGIAPVCNGWMNTYKVQAYEAIFLWPRTILIPN